MIRLHNIFKSYSNKDAETFILKGISVTIYSGEMVAIVGASGSGKSTLMNILGFLDKADKGDYVFKQQNVANLDEDALASFRNQAIGFVFQQFNLLPRFSAKQNVALPLIYRHLKPSEIEERVMTALKRVGMDAFAERKPTQLSGGQQQRVAIARALVGDPQMILADEPTGALDSKTGATIMDLFLSLHAEGKTVLLVTHDHQIAAQCKRRITIVDGQIESLQ
ncbi:MAG: ABC transporter ATP-binding protein [Legionella sp.]|nr:ABC transporter ATP-binding protein [Legionella sp.]